MLNTGQTKYPEQNKRTWIGECTRGKSPCRARRRRAACGNPTPAGGCAGRACNRAGAGLSGAVRSTRASECIF